MTKTDKILRCKDYTVSGEEFELHYDHDRDMLVTLPKPGPSELPKYYESETYISHTDGKKGWFEKSYQLIKKYALSQKVKLITKCNLGTGSLLDIGAGTGDFLVAAKSNGWVVMGSEPNKEAQDLAKRKGIALENNTSIFESSSFDVITMWHVLEHVYDLEKQLSELKRLIKADGHLIIAVPNFKSYDANYYKEHWAAYDVPRHLWHFSKNSIEELFKNNFFLDKVIPMKFDAYYVSLLSEKYKTGKTNIFNAILCGLRSNYNGWKKSEYSSHIYVLKSKKS